MIRIENGVATDGTSHRRPRHGLTRAHASAAVKSSHSHSDDVLDLSSAPAPHFTWKLSGSWNKLNRPLRHRQPSPLQNPKLVPSSSRRPPDLTSTNTRPILVPSSFFPLRVLHDPRPRASSTSRFNPQPLELPRRHHDALLHSRK